MSRKSGPILIVVSVLLGIGAAWVANDWIRDRTTASTAAKASVVVAATEIPFGTKVEARHVRLIEMVPGSEPSGVFRDPQQVIGRVSTGNVLPGELLLAPRFVTHESGSALSAMVDQRMRAVTVRVDDVVGVAGFLLPGNRVDVLASRRVEQNRATTETILQYVKVLAVDQTAATEKNEPVVVRAVTLEVTPAQAEVLVRHEEEGSLQLTLRNPLDDMEVPLVADVSRVAVPPPVPASPPPRRVVARAAPPREPPVTVIRGTQVRDQAATL
jgi:pilus assembly protein CpaB